MRSLLLLVAHGQVKVDAEQLFASCSGEMAASVFAPGWFSCPA